MSKKFASMFGRFAVAGLNVVRTILYIVSAPFGALMTVYGLYFIVIGFAWIVLVDAAFDTAVLVFCANFFMFFVALFDYSTWATMGGMWNWLWSWFADGNVALWPHIVRSFPPYFGAGIVFMLVINFTEWLKSKAVTLKAKYAIA